MVCIGINSSEQGLFKKVYDSGQQTTDVYITTSLLVAALLAVYIIAHYVKESTCMYKLSPSRAE